MPTRWHAYRSVVVWAVATLAGIGVCWLGVRPVLDAAVPDRLVAFPTLSRPPAIALPPSPTPRPTPSPSHHPSSSRSPSTFSSSGTPSAPSTVVIDGWTKFPDGHYTRTFQLVGGTATVSATDGALDLVAATPKPGNVMTITPSSNDRLVVTFTGLRLQASTLDARWSGDRPTATVTELP